jgi:hypothetical protein
VRGLGDVVEALRAPALADACSEFLKLHQLALVMVPGSVEDERKFSAMILFRSDRRSRLKASHLTVCARLFKYVLFEPPCFPYAKAICVWYDRAAVHGRYMGGVQ